MNRFGVHLAGLVCSLVVVGCASNGAKHGEERETPVALNDVPAPVRATLDRESAGGSVTEIERELKNGKTVYSADLTVKGVAWDITIAEDGTVISKTKEKDGEE